MPKTPPEPLIGRPRPLTRRTPAPAPDDFKTASQFLEYESVGTMAVRQVPSLPRLPVVATAAAAAAPEESQPATVAQLRNSLKLVVAQLQVLTAQWQTEQRLQRQRDRETDSAVQSVRAKMQQTEARLVARIEMQEKTISELNDAVKVLVRRCTSLEDKIAGRSEPRGRPAPDSAAPILPGPPERRKDAAPAARATDSYPILGFMDAD